MHKRMANVGCSSRCELEDWLRNFFRKLPIFQLKSSSCTHNDASHEAACTGLLEIIQKQVWDSVIIQMCQCSNSASHTLPCQKAMVRKSTTIILDVILCLSQMKRPVCYNSQPRKSTRMCTSHKSSWPPGPSIYPQIALYAEEN